MSKKHSKTKLKKKSGPSMASTADRHILYEGAVQCVEAEIDFVDEQYTALRGRPATLLREDFCGTAATSCEWVQRRKGNRAIGVDFDAEVLEWGRNNKLSDLNGVADNITLIEGDVMAVKTEPSDITLAMNFSYWTFSKRDVLKNYFMSVRDNLADDGLFILDVYGGSDAFRELREKRKIDGGYTYIWDQAEYNPITGEYICHIDFRLKDGSQMKKAFTYHWRLWTLPELRDLLDETGYKNVTVYWEGTDEETDEGDGVFTPAVNADADPGWVSYIIAEK